MAQQTAMPQELPKRLPLVIQPENRDESTAKDAKLINAYIETDKQSGEVHLCKRPGLLQSGATIAGTGLGLTNWLGDIYRIQGASIYKNDVVIAGGAPNGALNTANGVYRWSACLGATPALQFGNGTGSYNYDGTTPITTIAGANFPTPVKGWAYLDGTTYVVNSAASIRGCTSLNAPIVWTDATNAIIAQIEPDQAVALNKQLVYVICFKQWTTEVFYDALNFTASPLGPVQGAKMNYGLTSADTVQEMDGMLFWVATNKGAAPQVAMLDNLKLTLVSTKAIERLLSEADYSSISSFSLKYEGHRFYGVTLKNANLTLVYDATENMWGQWTDTNGNYFPIVASTYTTAMGKLLQHESNGKVYLADAAYTTDDGAVITVDVYTPNFDGGTKFKKTLNVLKFVGDQTAGSILQVRTNDFDFDPKRWTNFRYADMSQPDPMLTKNGTFRRRAHHLRHQSLTRLRLTAAELQMDLGTS